MNLKNRAKKNVALISTRPYEKNIILLKELVDTNISLLNYPLTEIKPLKNYAKFDSILSNLKKYQHIIFISTNAVHFFVERFKSLKIKLPEHIIYSSIGPATQKSLENHFNINVHCPKEIYDSKNLIANKIFNNLQDKKVLIIRGEGGRETLKDKLEEKGAEVHYGESYIRNYLLINLNQLQQETQNYNSIFLIISSYESAEHFLTQNKTHRWDWLESVNIIVNHSKIKDVLSLISNNIIVTNDLSKNSLLRLISSH
jgi:uroporphyrinogen-III synthase